MEPKVSCPNPCPPIVCIEDPLQYYHPKYTQVFQSVCSAFCAISLYAFLYLPSPDHIWSVPCPFLHPSFYYPHSVRRSSLCTLLQSLVTIFSKLQGASRLQKTNLGEKNISMCLKLRFMCTQQNGNTDKVSACYTIPYNHYCCHT